jgi:serine/threonine-protein kinase RsbW
MSSGFSLSATATEAGVRDLLSQARYRLCTYGLPEDCLGMIELVWAEALNNIAEHAYAGGMPGPVEMTVTIKGQQILAELRDQGRPLPGLSLPSGRLPESGGPVETLPEGRFGWFLIRDLCDTVCYRREAGKNYLTLTICA